MSFSQLGLNLDAATILRQMGRTAGQGCPEAVQKKRTIVSERQVSLSARPLWASPFLADLVSSFFQLERARMRRNK